MSMIFEEQGYRIIPFEKKADVYLINTCTVTQQATKKSRNVMQRARRSNPDAIIIVTGCYAQMEAKSIAKSQDVDYILGTNEKSLLKELIHGLRKQEKPQIRISVFKELKNIFPAYNIGGRTRSFLKIQDGCDYFCSYCTIPLARGRSRSISIPELVSQAKRIAEKGMREIILSGVNIGDYGKNLNVQLIDLLHALTKLDGIDRIRISSIEPDLLHPEIIALAADSNIVMPHFHIPLQTASNELLKKMRRRYQKETVIEKVEHIKSLMPDAFIGMDVICGLPGETDAFFEESMALVKKLPVSFVHVFTYSERKHTRAATIAKHTPHYIRTERSKILHALSNEKLHTFYLSQIGKERKVLFETHHQTGISYGHTDNYVKAGLRTSTDLTNAIKSVKLLAHNKTDYHIKAEIVNQ